MDPKFQKVIDRVRTEMAATPYSLTFNAVLDTLESCIQMLESQQEACMASQRKYDILQSVLDVINGVRLHVGVLTDNKFYSEDPSNSIQFRRTPLIRAWQEGTGEGLDDSVEAIGARLATDFKQVNKGEEFWLMVGTGVMALKLAAALRARDFTVVIKTA